LAINNQTNFDAHPDLPLLDTELGIAHPDSFGPNCGLIRSVHIEGGEICGREPESNRFTAAHKKPLGEFSESAMISEQSQ
jgi:hypothetical protein